MRKLILLLFVLTTTFSTFAQRVNSLIPNRLQTNPAFLNRSAEGDTVFFFDGTYYSHGVTPIDKNDRYTIAAWMKKNDISEHSTKP